VTDRHKRILGWTAVGVFAALVVFFWFLPPSREQVERVDFTVYWGAVHAMLTGGGLYEYSILSDGQVLPFVYPPFAAILMIPAALTGLERSAALWSLLQLPATMVLAWLVVRNRTGFRNWSRMALVSGTAAVWLGLSLSSPVSFGIGLGQVSLMLVTVVALDLVVVPPRWRGILVGLAAAVKLTPAAFVLYLLVTRQWRAALQAVAAFCAATAISWLILPAQSWQYWTQVIFQSDRIGTVSWLRNKSLLGFLAHWEIGGDWQWLLWVVGCLLIVAIGCYRAVQLYRRDQEFAAVILFGLVGCVISPITWSHHVVWLVMIGLYLAVAEQRWARVLGLVLVVSCVTPSPWWVADLHPALWLRVMSSLPLVTSVVLLVLGLPKRVPSAATEATAG